MFGAKKTPVRAPEVDAATLALDPAAGAIRPAVAGGLPRIRRFGEATRGRVPGLGHDLVPKSNTVKLKT